MTETKLTKNRSAFLTSPFPELTTDPIGSGYGHSYSSIVSSALPRPGTRIRRRGKEQASMPGRCELPQAAESRRAGGGGPRTMGGGAEKMSLELGNRVGRRFCAFQQRVGAGPPRTGQRRRNQPHPGAFCKILDQLQFLLTPIVWITINNCDPNYRFMYIILAIHFFLRNPLVWIATINYDPN